MALIGKKPRPGKVSVFVVRWNDASHHQVTRTFARLEDAERFASNGRVAMEPGRLYNANAGRTMELEAATDGQRPAQLSLVPELARQPDPQSGVRWSDRSLGR